MKYSLQNLKNTIDFFFRQKISFSRKNYYEKSESKEGLFAKQKALEKEKYLFEKFNLNYLKSNSTRQNYLENLYVLDVFDKFLELDFEDNLKVLDIGCKNWFYAQGEYAFFKKYCKSLNLDGIELDTNRLYLNFYSRAEVAKFYMRNLVGSNYISRDFLDHDEKYNYIVWFLPFVFESPHSAWGLPLKYFNPGKMLEHAYNSLEANGKILIVNQCESEYVAQQNLCKKNYIPFTPLGEIKSDILQYKYPRYAVLIKK